MIPRRSGQPRGRAVRFGSSILPTPTSSPARRRKRELTVALSGDGADELFCRLQQVPGRGVPGALRWRSNALDRPAKGSCSTRMIRVACPRRATSRLGELGRKARRFLDGVSTGDAAAERHDRWMRYAIGGGDQPPARAGGQRGESRSCRNDARSPRGLPSSHGGTDLSQPDRCSPIFSLALPTDMLVQGRYAASMLNSLEVRVPFLDHRVVELAIVDAERLEDEAARSRKVGS